MLDMGRGENLLLINGHKKQKSDCNFWVVFFFCCDSKYPVASVCWQCDIQVIWFLTTAITMNIAPTSNFLHFHFPLFLLCGKYFPCCIYNFSSHSSVNILWKRCEIEKELFWFETKMQRKGGEINSCIFSII